MSVSSCPRCHRPVSLPAQASPSVRVRCPLCAGEYSLQESLSYVPPALEVIAATAPAFGAGILAAGLAEPEAEFGLDPMPQAATHRAEPAKSAWDAVEFDQPESDELEMTPDDMLEAKLPGEAATPDEWFNPGPSSDEMPARAFGDEDSLGPPVDFGDDMSMEPAAAPVVSHEVRQSLDKAAGKVTPAKSLSPGKMRRPASNGGIGSVIGKIFGLSLTVVLALVIVLQIMWRVVGNDPGNIAKKLPEWAAFMAPEEMRKPNKPVTPKPDPNAVAKNNPVTPVTPDPMPEPMPTDPPDNTDVKPVPDPADPVKPITPDPVDVKPVPVPVPPVEAVGLVNAVEVTAAEFGKALKEVSDAKKELTEVDPTDETLKAKFSALNRAYFMKAFTLAEKVTHVKKDPADFSMSQRLDAIRTTLTPKGADNADLAALGRIAAIWIPAPTRKEPGIVIAGKVQSVTQRGALFATKIELLGEIAEKYAKEYVVVSATKLPGVEQNLPAVILGVLVDSPQTNIRGFVGDEPIVVWSTHVVDLGGTGTPTPATEKPTFDPPKTDTPNFDPPKVDPATPDLNPLPPGDK